MFLFRFLHDKLFLEYLIEYTNKKKLKYNTILRNNALKTLQLDLKGSAPIHIQTNKYKMTYAY